MKRALVAVDRSAINKSLIHRAFEYARHGGIGHIDFVHVLEIIATLPTGGSGMVTDIPSLDRQREEEARRFFENTIEEELGATPVSGTTYDVIITLGTPYNEIVTIAEREKHDIIIIGHRGMSNLKRFFIGSVAAKVVRHAPCDVLVHKPRGG